MSIEMKRRSRRVEERPSVINRALKYISYATTIALLSACSGNNTPSSSETTMPSSAGFSSSSFNTASQSSYGTIETSKFQSRNIPRNTKIAFFMGQDTTTLRTYKTEVLDNPDQYDMPAPAGITLYTSILPVALANNTAPSDANLYISGIEGPPADNGNGEVNFQESLAAYDSLAERKSALAVGLYLSDEWNDCSNQPLRSLIAHINPATGDFDPDIGSPNDPNSLISQWRYAIDRMITWLKNQERPIYLRIGYEFDGSWNCYNQDFYKQTFIYIKERIDALEATNIATVWQAATYPDDGDSNYHYNLTDNGGSKVESARAHYNRWYPGDAYVDWVGISFFAGAQYLTSQWSCQDNTKPWTVPDLSPRELQDTLVNFAKDHTKPVIIAESAPQGYNLKELSWSCVAARQDNQSGHTFSSPQEAWNNFFSDYFQWIENNKDSVRVVAYINTVWQNQSRWFCEENANTCPAGYWGNTAIQANSSVLNLFKTMLQQPLYQFEGVLGSSAAAANSSRQSSEPHHQQSSVLSSSSTTNNSAVNSAPNQCPTSHPFYASNCEQCFANIQQAQASDCSNTSSASDSNSATSPDTETIIDRSNAFNFDGGTWLEDGVVISRRAERYRVRHELSTENFNNYNIEYWVGRFGWFELRDYTRPSAAKYRPEHCGSDTACVVVTLHGAVPAAMTDAEGNTKDCNQQVPNWRYHKTYGSETDFAYGYVMEIITDNGQVIPACSATQEQRRTAMQWRAVMRPDANIPRRFTEGEQIEFETTINFSRANTLGDNVNYYGQTFKYILGQGFAVNNQDPAIGPLHINDTFAQLGGDTSVPQLSKTGGSEQRFAFMQHAYNIGPNHIQGFLNGRRLFHTDFNNGNHIEPFKPGPQASNGNLPFPELAGLASNPIQNSCTQCHELNGNGPVQNTQNVTPPKLIGLGLLEAIKNTQIEAWAKENGGKVNRVTIDGGEYIGRFGWRAETVSVKQQTAKALLHDMGIGTAFEGFGPEELNDQHLEALTLYTSLLAVPTPRKNLTKMAGHVFFQEIGCDSCHKMTVTTGEHPLSELSQQTIHPYTDLLLHDLGEGEYRTAPLWGLGLSGYVRYGDDVDGNGDYALMHDGLSSTIEQAINRHASAANHSRMAFLQLSADKKTALINYLKAL